MTALLVALHKTPENPQAYDEHYFTVHVPLARKLPGLLEYEVSTGLPVTADGPSGRQIVALLRFADVKAAQDALASEEGQAAISDLAEFARPGDVELLIFDVRDLGTA